MKKYLYAISAVAHTSTGLIHNQMNNGTADLEAIITDFKKLSQYYDSTAADDIVLINCNITEERVPLNSYQFNHGYNCKNISECINDLILEIKNKVK